MSECRGTLIFWSKKYNGGYGDRLVGMSAGITIARVLGMKFLSNWEDDYKVLCEAGENLIVNIPAGYYDLNIFNQKRNAFLENDNILANLSGKTVLFQANQPVDILLWSNPFLKDLLAGRSYEAESIKSYQEIFSKYIPLKNLEVGEGFSCGIQIRCGDTYCMPHRLAEQYIPESEFPRFASQVKAYLIDRGIVGRVFLTSDAHIMYDHFAKLSDDRIEFVFIKRSEDIHFDFYNSNNKYIGIVKEHMMLQNCRMIITGLRSNFGTTAAYCSKVCEEMVLYSSVWTEPLKVDFKAIDCKEKLVLKEYCNL